MGYSRLADKLAVLPNLQAAVADLGWTLREESADDLDFLCQLYCADRAAEFSFLPEAQRQFLLAQQFNARYADYHSVKGRWFGLLTDASDRRVGHLALALGPPALHLIDIALSPAARGAGAGGALLRGLIDDAQSQAWDVELHVLINNPAARLYSRLGFVPVAESPPYRAMRWRHSGG